MSAPGFPSSSAAASSASGKDKDGGGGPSRDRGADKDMADLQAYERELYSQLDALERHIYVEETRYLEDTAQGGAGNIVVGWEGAIEGKLAGRRGPDRLFSGSSATWDQQQKEAAAAANAGNGNQENMQQWVDDFGAALL
jgi:hypothetical protein